MSRADLAAVVRGIAPVVRSVITAALAALTARVETLEAVRPVPGPAGKDGAPGVDGARGLDGKDGKDGRDGRDGKDGRDGADGAAGPAGERGPAGRDGIEAFDLEVAYDGERTVTLKVIGGATIETRSIRFPVVLYRGVFEDARAYEAGDCVTWGGAMWIAKGPTTGARPGLAAEASRVWQLSCKAGRDGKAGKDGKDGKG